MEKDIKKWADALVNNFKQRKAIGDYSNELMAVTPSEFIHMHKGIVRLAKVLGEELEEDFAENRELCYYYSFEYRGVKFLQAEREKLI